jgi:quinohemoprotein ethanol dehydrogenase
VTTRIVAALLLTLVGGLGTVPAQAAGTVDAARLAAVDAEPDNWFTGGRDRDGSYYSPLTIINAGNVARLGYAWSYDLGTFRGQEATPVMVDGVLYTSGVWGVVTALDAASGREVWRYDPEVPGQVGRNSCCDIVNRGVAVWRGKVYVASLDGRLHALDAASGKLLWQTDSLPDHQSTLASTGAPQIAGDVVVIGNSGGDMDEGGVRGSVAAFDLDSGQLKWRFYTVPPAPGQPFEQPELAMAAKTWDPGRDPKYKGGGTVWDGMAYDQDSGLLYIGTGNTAPYDTRQLGGRNGDDLFVASILAIEAKTGHLVWHFQTTPQDRWDFDADQKLVLANLTVKGKPHRVVMQASKNGFFYVLDARTGAFLSGRNFAFVNWTKGLSPKTGRPIASPDGDYFSKPKTIYPSPAGAHNWPPMSYSRQTGLVYIPAIDAATVLVDMAHNGGMVKYANVFFTVFAAPADETYDAASLQRDFGPLPDLDSVKRTRKGRLAREFLRAWDPVRQRLVWQQETSAGVLTLNGGVMSSAGNLVFQGRGNGELWVYAADSGKVLKVIETGSHIMAAPMTYAIGGVQYVVVQVGLGGAGIGAVFPPESAANRYQNVNRIIAFRLDGGAVPLPPPRQAQPFLPPPTPVAASAAVLRQGEIKFVEQCSRCHVFGPAILPDLRKMSADTHAAFQDIVLQGARAAMGMGRFDDLLSPSDVEAIHAYLIDEGRKGYLAQQHGE